MKKIVFYLAIMFLFAQLSAVEDEIETPDYQSELTKFYFEKGEYRLATLAFAAIEAEPQAEIRLLEARAWLQLDSLRIAQFKLADLQKQTANDSIKTAALNLLTTSLAELPPLEQIKVLIEILERRETEQLDLDLLLLLAQKYEQIKLYTEANDIYQLLLEHQPQIAAAQYQLKIALNQIYKKDFEAALQYLDPILATADSLYLADALFYSYIAHYALQEYESAQEQLLKLYYGFPDDERRSEVLEQLADLARRQKQYLLSWYWLEELYAISERADKMIIWEKISQLKKLLYEADTLPNQFEALSPIDPQYLESSTPPDTTASSNAPPQDLPLFEPTE
ncbi:MAG: hypothetical protein R6U84_06625 [Candidatus Cloacimonadales bacterium]